MELIDALRLIISRSPAAMDLAIAALRAPETTRQTRYNMTAMVALRDPTAEFTADERDGLASLIDAPDTRVKQLNIRLTEEEYETLATLARGVGQSISEYVRVRVLQ